MTQSRTLAAAGVVALLSALLVGCGGEDALTAKEFRSQANKLCADASDETEKFGADISQTSSDADVTEAIDKTVERNNELVADIEDLEAPESMADDVDSMLDSVRDGIKELDKISSIEDLLSVDFETGPFAEADDKAKDLGLDKCAE